MTQYAELDDIQRRYTAAVDVWVSAIRREEHLDLSNHSMPDIDRWEQAHFDEEDAQTKVRVAKAAFEAALRQKFFHF